MTQQIPADIRERIIQAAADLYDQGGRQSLPTVDQVRRAARVDMNAASAIMREWRRAQTAQAAPVAVQVPEAVQQAGGAAVATIWQQAQALANESLHAAQAGWEAERAELDAIRQELADAYEAQAAELIQVQAAAEAANQAHHEQRKQTRLELAAIRAELAQATTRAERAEAAATEIERRAGELRTELNHAHQEIQDARAERDKAQQDADQARGALAEQQKASQAATSQLDQVRGELAKVQDQRRQAATEAHRQAERLTTTQAERDEARKVASQAREEAARLAGQLTATQEQAAALLARITPPAEAKPTATRKKGGE